MLLCKMLFNSMTQHQPLLYLLSDLLTQKMDRVGGRLQAVATCSRRTASDTDDGSWRSRSLVASSRLLLCLARIAALRITFNKSSPLEAPLFLLPSVLVFVAASIAENKRRFLASTKDEPRSSLRSSNGLCLRTLSVVSIHLKQKCAWCVAFVCGFVTLRRRQNND